MTRQVFEYHPVIGHRFIPNLKIRVKHETGGYLVKTNNLGFRANEDFVKEKLNKNTRRVLLFGDSYSAGDGVSNGKRFSNILSSDIDNLEVYNFAMSATGTGQQYLIYQEFAKDIENDLVIIVVLAENIRRVNSAYKIFYNREGNKVTYQKPYYKLTAENELAVFNIPPDKSPYNPKDLEKDSGNYTGKHQKLRSIVNKMGMKDVVQKFTGFQPLPEYNSASNPEWLLMKAILTDWIKTISSKVLLVPLPIYQYTEETSSAKKFQTRFKELAQELDVYLHDPLEDFQKYSMEERRKFRFETDIHPTPFGHQAIAKSIQPTIEKILKS